MEALFLGYKDKEVLTALYMTRFEDFIPAPEQILSKTETEKYNTFRTETGKREFLLGRYSAKRAYIQLTQQDRKFKDIEIRNGVFEQPFFLGDSEFDVSIAHTQCIGGAIVFDKAYPMGLDIEIIDKSKIEVLQEAVESEEIKQLDIANETALTLAWCMKEALTKATKTGLTVPLELLRIEDLIWGGYKNAFICRYKNFMQYKGVAKIQEDYVIALAYPQQLTIGEFL